MQKQNVNGFIEMLNNSEIHSSVLKNGATAESGIHSLVLPQDCPNPNKYPNVRKQDFNSSLAAVW